MEEVSLAYHRKQSDVFDFVRFFLSGSKQFSIYINPPDNNLQYFFFTILLQWYSQPKIHPSLQMNKNLLEADLVAKKCVSILKLSVSK